MIRGRWKLFVSTAAGYLVCVLVSRYLVVEYLAPLVAGVGYRITHSAATTPQADFYAAHWLLFNAIAGVLVGFLVYASWRSTVLFFMWIPAGGVLFLKILTYHQSVFTTSGLTSRLDYFFATGCEVST